MKYCKTRHDLISPTELSGFVFSFSGGALKENEGERGAFHLLEHILANSINDLLPDFSRDGIGWNAYTGDSGVFFTLTGFDDVIDKYSDLYFDRVMNYKITKKILEKERNIVIQEYHQCFDSQSDAHFINLFRVYTDYFMPIGNLGDIETVSLEQINEMRKKWFETPSIVLDISNRNKENRFLSLTAYEGWNCSVVKKIIEENKKLNNRHIVQHNEGMSSIMIISDPIDLREESGLFNYINSICITMGNSLHSPFYSIIREKHGLVYSIGFYFYRVSDTSGYIVFACSSETKNICKIKELFHEIIHGQYFTEELYLGEVSAIKYQLRRDRINLYRRAQDYFLMPNELNPLIDYKVNYKEASRIYSKYFQNWFVSVDTEDF